MKQVIDKTRSRRPILEPDEKDFHATSAAVNRITTEVTRLEKDLESKKNNPEYIKVVSESYERMLEIALKRMSFPVSEIEKHAEIVGQFNERLRLTAELLNAKSVINERRSLLGRVSKKLRRLAETLNLTGDDDGY